MSYRMSEVIKMTGAARSQIEFWTRFDWLPDARHGGGTGRHRRYTDADVSAIRAAIKLYRKYGQSAPRAYFLKNSGAEQ